MSCSLYIVRCSDASLYIGISNNVLARVKKHNLGLGAQYTAMRRPVFLVYTEKYEMRKKAAQRERQIKR